MAAFKQNTPTAKGAGYTDQYATLLTARGRLKKKSGNRSLSFGAVGEENSFEFITYYQTALANSLNTAMKVEIESKTYTIDSWEKVGEEKFFYIIQLTQKNG